MRMRLSCNRARMHARCIRNTPMMRASGSNFDGFSNRDLDKAVVSIMGDLHLAPEQMHLFNQARDQLVKAMSGPDGQLLSGARVVQLGDLGHGKYGSGGMACFEYARAYFDGFKAPASLVLGNHDLEGAEFESDEQNLAAWLKVFQQPHYWAADLGPVLAIGLSTVRYRSNLYSHHEVYIDDEQYSWLQQQLEQSSGRPIVVFTHAPPIGCGLKVLQNVHVKNRCAWINHSDRPERFIQLVDKHPNIKLWFSGHFHLSHNYPDSIFVVGGTAFVQTGVIGECNRDGQRHSRVLMIDAAGYQLHTMDHDTGCLRLDMQAGWTDSSAPQPQLPPEEELLCDPSSGWLCSKLGPRVGENNGYVRWFPVGSRSILALQDELLVEYDLALAAPIGLVCKVPEGCSVQLLGADGLPSTSDDGADVASVVVTNPNTGPQVFPRNQQGGFYSIYQPNKWRLKKEKEAAEREAAVAAAAS